MNMELLITNIGYTIGIVFSLVFPLFIYFKSPNRAIGSTFLLLSHGVAIFEISHLLGINTLDPELSRLFFMANLVCIPIVVFSAHFIFLISKTIERQKNMLIFFYITGAILFLLFTIFPDTFLLVSKPKMYFPNYYDAGILYWAMRAYFLIVSLYFFAVLLIERFKTQDFLEKRRFDYAMIGLFFGYIVGQVPVPLVFNIPVDPILSIFLSFYVVPIGYAAIKYNFANIEIIARKALFYALTVTGFTLFISLLNYSNGLIIQRYGPIAQWIMPIVSSIAAVWIGTFVWKKTRETDILKTEFISIISHKFRTPLTHIKWATDMIASTEHNPDTLQQIKNIGESNKRLIELSNMLVATAEAGNSGTYAYNFVDVPLIKTTEDMLNVHSAQIIDKKLTIKKDYDVNEITINADMERIKFALQTLIENALHYTPIGGTIEITLKKEGKLARIGVSDSGIGLDPKELHLVFTRFYRTDTAKSYHTEGVGIGLFLTKIIIERHGGKISVTSEGKGKGTAFSVTVPLIQNA